LNDSKKEKKKEAILNQDWHLRKKYCADNYGYTALIDIVCLFFIYNNSFVSWFKAEPNAM